MMTKKFPVVVFDFDGVLVEDSDEIFKNDAWTQILSPWVGQYEPHFATAKTLYGYGKPGGRKEILAHTLSGLGLTEPELFTITSRLVTEFSESVYQQIIGAGLVPGARATLQALQEAGCTMALNSGTSTADLRRAAVGLEIDHYFPHILGSTKEPQGGSKVENLTTIAAAASVTLADMVMIGDSMSDYTAAVEFGCAFVGIHNRHNQWQSKELPFLVATMDTLEAFI
jgi:phosphoglycolate phosphatase